MNWISGLLVLLTLLPGIMVMWFCVQIVSACMPRPVRHKPLEDVLPEIVQPGEVRAVQVVVLVPAHNESVNLLPTLKAVQAESSGNVRVLVVADNCIDDTAEVARSAGVEVIERHCPTHRGKGYALDYGLQHLKARPPEVVIVLDADCLPRPGSLDILAGRALTTGRPVQALYLMHNAPNPGLKARIAEFAWVVKNHVRPRGLHRLGLPCQLTGSGMAFHWNLLQDVSLANGNIVEDMQLGMTLATQGNPPLFAEDTQVISFFPLNREGIDSQRTRWEHGHLAMMRQEGMPRLIQGLRTGDLALAALALDLCIPPLALLVSGLFAWSVLTGLFAWATGHALAWELSLATLLLMGLSVGLAWHVFGRSVVSGGELLMAPLYMISKFPVYVRFLFRRQAQWVRSKRDNETG